jgi:hypothetical protein
VNAVTGEKALFDPVFLCSPSWSASAGFDIGDSLRRTDVSKRDVVPVPRRAVSLRVGVVRRNAGRSVRFDVDCSTDRGGSEMFPGSWYPSSFPLWWTFAYRIRREGVAELGRRRNRCFPERDPNFRVIRRGKGGRRLRRYAAGGRPAEAGRIPGDMRPSQNCLRNNQVVTN